MPEIQKRKFVLAVLTEHETASDAIMAGVGALEHGGESAQLLTFVGDDLISAAAIKDRASGSARLLKALAHVDAETYLYAEADTPTTPAHPRAADGKFGWPDARQTAMRDNFGAPPPDWTGIWGRNYYHAIMQCVARYRVMALPHADLLAFLDEFSVNIPLVKLSRWLGYVQGVLVARGATTVEAEREWTRPLFRQLDYKPV